MKTFYTLFLSISLLSAVAQHPLNVSGSISIVDINADSTTTVTKGLEAVIEIRKQEKNEDISMKVETDGNGKYEFKLPYYPADFYYVSVVSSGCPTKQFVISTYGINPKDSLGEFNPIVADIELYKIPEGKFNADLYDSPMNQFYFDEEEQNFTYDEEYLELTNRAQQLFKKSIIDFKTKKLLLEEVDRNKNTSLIYSGALILLAIIIILLLVLYRKAKHSNHQFS